MLKERTVDMNRRGAKRLRQNKTRGNIERIKVIQRSFPDTNTVLSMVTFFNQCGEKGSLHC